ncbi:DUF2784 domain-containing protein [Marinobacteraceae bacterium S3BR75-40.1]
MFYSLAADAVLIVHFLFILFVMLGGFLVWRWSWIAWLHLPAVIWGALVEFNHWVCPLTPLENALRRAGEQQGSGGDFIGHYLLPVIYPAGLTAEIQGWLGGVVVLVNVSAYAGLWFLRRQKKRA